MVKLNCLLLSLLIIALYFDCSDSKLKRKNRKESKRLAFQQSKYGKSYVGEIKDIYSGKEIVIEGSMKRNSDGYDVEFSSDLSCKETSQQPLTIYVRPKKKDTLCNTRILGVVQRSSSSCTKRHLSAGFYQTLKHFTLKIIFYTNNRIEIWMNDKYAFNFPKKVRVDLIKALCIGKHITLDWVLVSVEKPKDFIPVNVFSSEAKIIVYATPTNNWFNFELRCVREKSYNISAQLGVYFDNHTVTVTSKLGRLFLKEASYFTDFPFIVTEEFNMVWTIRPDLIEINVNNVQKYHKQDVEKCQKFSLYWSSIPIVNKIFMT